MKAVGLMLLLMAAGCLSPAPEDAQDESSQSSEGTQDPCKVHPNTGGTPYPSQVGCTCPWADGCGPPQIDADAPTLTTNASVRAGESVKVRAHNGGTAVLFYDNATVACQVDAWTEQGRQVWDYCGVDYRDRAHLEPGQERDVWVWRAVECTHGRNYGYGGSCMAYTPLAPGRYFLVQPFCVDADFSACDLLAGTHIDVVA